MVSLAQQLAEEWKRRPANLPAARLRHDDRAVQPDELEGSVVLVGLPGDEHVAAVAGCLTGRDRRVTVFDLGADRQSSALSLFPSVDPASCQGLLCRSAAAIRPLAHHDERTLYDESAAQFDGIDTHQFNATERRAAVLGLVASLDTPVAINDPWSSARAELKSNQLSVARRCGLATPRTIITDDGDAVRDFADDVGSSIVYKSLDDPVVWRDGERAGFLFTSIVTPQQLRALPAKLDCPGIFQERLEIESEFRVTVVGGQAFTARCDPPADGEVDWRRGLLEGVAFESSSLDPAMESRVIDLVARLGLEYAAADLVATRDELHLLEVNPDGAYLWLERTLGSPITESICDRIESA